MTSSENKNIRVIMLLGSLPPLPVGGAEVQALKLTRLLEKSGVEVEVITWGKLWHRRKGEMNGIRYTRIRSLLNLITDIPSFFKRNIAVATGSTKIEFDDSKEKTNEVTGKVWAGMIMRYQLFYINALIYLWLRRKKFQIIHVHMMEWPSFVGTLIAKALNKHVVIKDSTMNGITNLLRYPDGKEKQQLIAQSAHCVAMTRIIQDNLLKAGVPANHIYLIPNGIDITPIPEKKHAWNNKVIFVGNLFQQPAKGVDILLKAWIEVVKIIPDARLSLVGDGNLADYQLYAEKLGIASTVNFLGKRKDVQALVSDSDVFVLPSRREGMSNALMEAMLSAMPIVATNVSGSQDLIENKKSGLIVEPARVSELAKAIIYMLQHPEEAKQMGNEAYKSVKAKCDIVKIAEQYKELYKQILGGNDN